MTSSFDALVHGFETRGLRPEYELHMYVVLRAWILPRSGITFFNGEIYMAHHESLRQKKSCAEYTLRSFLVQF